MAEKVKIDFEGDASKFIKELQKSNRELKLQNIEMRKIASQSKKTARVAGGAFKRLGTTITRSIAGVGGVIGTIGRLKRAFEDLRRAREESLDEALRADKAQARLRTLAVDPKTGKVDRDLLSQLEGRVRGMRLQTGIGVVEASDLVFQTQSVGLQQFAKSFATLRNELKDPAQFAKSLSQFSSSFKELNDNVLGSANIILSAAQFASADPLQVGRGAAQAAAGITFGGLSPELGASLVALLSRTAEPGEAATRASALGFSLADPDVIKKFGLQGLEGVEKLNKLIFTDIAPGILKKELGRKEAASAIQALRAEFASDFIRETLNVTRGQALLGKKGQGFFIEQLRSIREDKRTQQLRDFLRARESLRIAREERFGPAEASRQAQFLRAEEAITRQGDFEQIGSRLALTTFQDLQLPGESAQQAIGFGKHLEESGKVIMSILLNTIFGLDPKLPDLSSETFKKSNPVTAEKK